MSMSKSLSIQVDVLNIPALKDFLVRLGTIAHDAPPGIRERLREAVEDVRRASANPDPQEDR